ncbi:MAG: DEAD/DEAH box helicase, partial [Chitinivibrionales bacterium]|nr:DEAD/DEAH box helicase [Chitinivibrionales bacterium]
MIDTEEFLQRLKRMPFFEDQIVHVHTLPEKEPGYRDLTQGIDPALASALEKRGVRRLYSHQADVVDTVREGNSTVVVTGTASGKTLCYLIPVVEAVLADSRSTMLFVYPTKALAQDQLRGLNALIDSGPGITFTAGTYDGDTPANLRRKLRDGAHIILSNPDMLHQGIVPQHARWNRFFTHLRFVVIDEIHAYRGIFGSHLANVIRRLRRICAHYGSSPQFICCSATIANPKEHAERICGVSMKLVDNDGSPRGPKRFVLWNPPPIKAASSGDYTDWRAGGDRRSPVTDAVSVMTALVKEGVQTIAFVRTRLAAELIAKSCRERLLPAS